MVDWLVRRFVAHHDAVGEPGVRAAYGRLASVVSIACNVALCCGKGVVGILAHSVAITADAANNLADAASNVVALVGFKLASRPPDAEHPYGHGRYEHLSALGVSALVTLLGVELVRDALARVMRPEPVSLDAAGVAVLACGIAVKLWMARLNATLGRRISSDALAACAVDSRVDAIATAAVLAATLASPWTGLALDGWAGLGVGAFVVWNGCMLVRDTVDTLLGRAPDPELAARVRARVMATPGVLGMHDLMVHDYGPGRLFASAHVEMVPDVDVVRSHELLDGIEHDLWEGERLDITLHLDPVERRDAGTDGRGPARGGRGRAEDPGGSDTAAAGDPAPAGGRQPGGRGGPRQEGDGGSRTMPHDPRTYKAKQMIVMRRDLKMRKGKIAAQAAHACVEATLVALAREGRLGQLRVTPGQDRVWLDDTGTPPTPLASWFGAGVAKVCVYVDGEEALLGLAARGRELGFACSLVRDAGLTEFHGVATYTCLAFEPLYPEQIDPLTGELPLY